MNQLRNNISKYNSKCRGKPSALFLYRKRKLPYCDQFCHKKYEGYTELNIEKVVQKA